MKPRSADPVHPAHAILTLVLSGLPAPLCAQTPPQFALRTPAAIAAPPLREMAIGDLDGDGDLDVCGGTGFFWIGGKSVLLRNDGQERFTDVTATNLPNATGTTLLTVPFDMDGDGDLDLFVCKQNTPSRLWRNNGAGVFTDASANLPPTAINHYQVVAGDFDGDGDLDLAAALSFFYAGSLDRLFVNNGAGVFTDLPLNVPADTLGFVGTDFDGDGDLDLIAGSATGPAFRRNDGNFVFTDVTAAWFPPAPGSNVQSLAVGDLDGDGDPDLVCGRQNTTDLVLRHTGANYVLMGTLPTFGSGTKSLALFDCDEDGDLDLARSIVQAFTPVFFAVNDGSGTLIDTPSRLPPTSTFTARIQAADLDRDGDLELLTAEELGVPVNAVLINRQRDLVVGPAAVGQTWTIEASSEPGYATLHHLVRLGIGLVRLPQPLLIPSFGELWVDLAAPHVVSENIVFANAGKATFSIPVPPLSQLLGVELHVQAVLEQARHLAKFSAYRSTIVQ